MEDQPPSLQDNTELQCTMVPTTLGPCAVRLQSAPAPGNLTADVYLHGAAGSWTTFQPLLSTSPDRTRILIDLPGWGDSTQGAQLAFATVEAMAGVVVEVVEDLGYTKWNLVGHSMGGVIALHIAAARPERTLSVAAISPTVFGAANSVRRPWRGLATLPWFTGMLLIMRSMAFLGNAGKVLIRVVAATPLLQLLLRPLFADPAAVPPHVIRRLGQEARPGAFCAAARALAGYDFATWHSIRCHVLVLRGSADVFTPQSDLDHLAALGPHIRTLTLPRCGHFGVAEQPVAVQQLLEELWQR
ncbi:alpha/beta hydrolase [Arthrobacter sp. R3-55]